MIIALSSAEATAAVDRARRAQLIELAVCGRCPAKLSFLPAVTGHTWRENAPQSPKKMGVVDIARIPKAWPPRFDFGEEGIPSHDFSYFSIPFLPWVFHKQLFKVLRKKNEIHCTSSKQQQAQRKENYNKCVRVCAFSICFGQTRLLPHQYVDRKRVQCWKKQVDRQRERLINWQRGTRRERERDLSA